MTDTTHAPVCWSWGPRHYECAVGQIERDEALLRQALEALEALEAVVEHFDPYMGDNECRPMENARSTIAALRERLRCWPRSQEADE